MRLKSRTIDIKNQMRKNELPRDSWQFNVCWSYLLLPHLITGVVTISRALRKQRRAHRMSSSFLSRPQLGSGADPPPPQFCAKVVAASLARRTEEMLFERCCLLLPANGFARSLCSLHERPSLLRRKLSFHISSHPRSNPTGTDNPSLHRT